MYLISVLRDMGAFPRKRRPEVVKPERVYARFDEEWVVMGKCDRAKGVWVKCS